MINLQEELYRKALDLSPTERAELIESLLSSFNFPSRGKFDELWGTEAENRLDAYKRGEIEGIPANEVLERINKRGMS